MRARKRKRKSIKAFMKKKVVVGMSGGVDSSVAALLLKEQGYDVVGVTMQIWQDEEQALKEEHGGCCGLSAVEDARRVAQVLDIPYYVMNFKQEFREKVMDYFTCEYLQGRTPNPCIACNRYVKWESLLQRSLEIGADYIATGHYARIEQLPNGRYAIRNSVTARKDQTYALYNLTQDQLSHTLMPVGAYHKDEIRKMAVENDLPVAYKPDSQDICFVPDGDYAGFIERYTGKSFEPGNFVDQEGHVLGQHKGIICYTIGQRKGLGLALHEPMYVCRIDPKTNTVVLGRDRDLWSKELTAKDFHWISGEVPTGTQRIKAKIRYRHQEQWANAEITGPDSIHLVFDEPQRAITCGQSVVLYDGDVVVGGGTINGLCGSGSGMESGI